jgi:hypothetical protein
MNRTRPSEWFVIDLLTIAAIATAIIVIATITFIAGATR